MNQLFLHLHWIYQLLKKTSSHERPVSHYVVKLLVKLIIMQQTEIQRYEKLVHVSKLIILYKKKNPTKSVISHNQANHIKLNVTLKIK